MNPELERISGQLAWRLSSDVVELAVTQDGGHMAPVVFHRRSARAVQPYYISPWQEENIEPEEPVLRMLRGDFFCCPFGGGSRGRREHHAVHGEPAYARWRAVAMMTNSRGAAMTLELETHVRPGRIRKHIVLRQGENVVYTQHDLEGYRGAMPLGHHATLAPPSVGRLRISTSPIRFGETSPRRAGVYGAQEYYALAPGRRFAKLRRVPTVWKHAPWTDLSEFPAREGFVDIAAVVSRVRPGKPAWTCAVAPEAGYCWYAFRDPTVLPATVMWMENRGRHAAPWNGRNVCIGLEDVCSYFAQGLEASVASNPWNAQGIPTAMRLSPRRRTRIKYVQGVIQVPRGFESVADIRFEPGMAIFISEKGQEISAPVVHEYVHHPEWDITHLLNEQRSL